MARSHFPLSLAIVLVVGCGGDANGPPVPPPTATPTPGTTRTPTPSPTGQPSPDPGSPIALSRAGGSVLRSEDGGITWQVSLAISARPFLLDRFVGWATGGKQLFETADGGRTWTDRSAPLDVFSFGGFIEATFADRERGLLVATAVEEVSQPIIFQTADGGESWSTATIDAEPDDLPFLTSPSRSVCLTKAGIGILTWRSCCIGDEEKTFVAITADFGAHWEDVADRNGLSSDRVVRGVACAGDSDLWLIEGEQVPVGTKPREGRLLHSGDGGQTFSALPSPVVGEGEAIVDAVSFIDASVGWVATTTTSGLAIFRSEDGGETWALQLSPSDLIAGYAFEVSFGDTQLGLVSFYDLSFPYPQNPPPVLLVTDDGGRSWGRVDIDRTEASYGPVEDLWIRTGPVPPPPLTEPIDRDAP
jgi:photosystem II stability/assembly factor-like uncharacterized protein